MPAYPTLHDIAVLNAADPVVGLVDETMKAVPEVRLGAARSIKGIEYRTLVRTGLPSVGFRKANQGSPQSKSTYENRLVSAFPMNPNWSADKAVADVYEDGAQAYIAMEGAGMTIAAFQHLSQQFYYGAGQLGDQLGHPGLIQSYDSENMIVEAGGTTANTGSSVWAIKFGPTYAQWVVGNNGSLTLTDVIEQMLADGDGNLYPAYIQSLLAHVGLQVGNLRCVGRIQGLTDDAGHTLNDKLLGALYALFPVGFKPDAFFMTRRSLEQLRSSRTAVNPTGAEAPIPDSAFGVTIEPTDGISDVEPLTL